MEIDLFKYIAEIAPGFISVAVLDFLEGSSGADTKSFKDFRRYFLFAGANWLFIYMLKCFVALDEKAFIALSLLLSIAWAVVWHFWLGKMCRLLNDYLHESMGMNVTCTDPWILKTYTKDHTPNYFAVFKNGKLLEEGVLTYVNNDEYSLCIEQNKAWQEYYATHEHGERTIIYLDKDAYIKEYFIES